MATLFLIYLIGCLLSFLRIYASFRHLHRAYKIDLDFAEAVGMAMVTITSWCGFLAGIYIYFAENEKRFF